MKPEAQDAGNYIKSLIHLGENQHLDFKFEINDARKIARSFSAFANTEGGKLLIGVKDNGRIAGVRSEEEFYMAESAAQMFCKPEVDFKARKWFIEGRCVLEIDIAGSKRRPHFARNEPGEWTAYVRVGDQNMQADKILVDFWKNENNPKNLMLNYGMEEKALIEYLGKNERISLTRFIRIARTNHALAEKMLVKLMLMKIIRMDITEKGVYYRLYPEIAS
jgi:predicted HTH transcriptional regulator